MGLSLTQTRLVMSNTPTPLRERALDAYRAVRAEKLQEARLYGQLTLQDALQLKLWKLFGGEYIIDVEESMDDQVLGAEIEGLNFLGIRRSDSDIQLLLVESCPHCSYKMTSQPITSLAALGRELLQFEMMGMLSNHECSEFKTSPL